MQVAKITAVFEEYGDPKLSFEGSITPVHINALLLHIRLGYAKYTQDQRVKELREQKDRAEKSELLKLQLAEQARKDKEAAAIAEAEAAKAALEVLKEAEALATAENQKIEAERAAKKEVK